MKKNTIIFISLITLLIIALILIGISATNIEKNDLYSKAEHINSNQIYLDTKGVNYYYYYSETCTYCIEIKPEITNFYYYLQSTENEENIDLYLIDIDENPNLIDDDYASITEEQEMIQYLSDLDSPVIAGTPTLIETTDGNITNIKVGAKDIPAYLNNTYNY